MRRRFIINFMLIVVTALISLFAATYAMWLCATASLLVCITIFCMQIRSFGRYEKMLAAEKMLYNKQNDKLVQAEQLLNFHKAIMDKVDTAVMVSTSTGYAEWSNVAAKSILQQDGMLPAAIRDAVTRQREWVKYDGAEYALSCSSIYVGNSRRNIIVIKNIHSAIEKNRVEAWHKLVRVLTHEIMNSMSPIISLSSTLCNSIETTDFAAGDDCVDTLRHGLQIINRRSRGLLSFVENYRKLTHIATPQKSDFHVAALMDDIRVLFSQPFIEFINNTPAQATLFADRTQIEQVMINLIKNAIEACEARAASVADEECYEKHVLCSIGCCDDGNSVKITVCDNGVGILASVQEQVFVPFFTTKRNGSGIGLALCKQIVVNHDGNIEIESHRNDGCTVVCTLPIK